MYGNKDKDSPYQCDLMSLSGAQEIQSRSYWPRVSIISSCFFMDCKKPKPKQLFLNICDRKWDAINM